MSKHTPEPLQVMGLDVDCNTLVGPFPSGKATAAFASPTDAHRAVKCYNALSGIADPAAFVEAAKAVVEAGKSETYWIDRVSDAIAALANAAKVKP